MSIPKEDTERDLLEKLLEVLRLTSPCERDLYAFPLVKQKAKRSSKEIDDQYLRTVFVPIGCELYVLIEER